MSALGELPIWLCADLASAPIDAVRARTMAVLDAIPAAVWVRPTVEIETRALLALVEALVERAHARGGAVIVGSRVDVALAARADGVHLGTHAIPPIDVRHVLERANRTLYVSCAVHDAAEIDAASRYADALVLSPLDAVPRKGPALGAGRFASLVARAPARRFVALGGIVDSRTAALAATAGARAIAVRRALLEDRGPAEACRALRDAFTAALDPRAAECEAPPP